MVNELEEICLSFYDDVYNYIFWMGKDSDLAKDVTQDTFLKALKSLHNLRDISKVKSWLLSIARNNYLTEVKKRKRIISEELGEELIDVRILTPEQEYLLREKEEWWEQVLLNLTAEEQSIFNLRVNEKYSYEEIAEELTLKPGAVRVKFHRLKIKLINLVEKRVRANEGL